MVLFWLAGGMEGEEAGRSMVYATTIGMRMGRRAVGVAMPSLRIRMCLSLCTTLGLCELGVEGAVVDGVAVVMQAAEEVAAQAPLRGLAAREITMNAQEAFSVFVVVVIVRAQVVEGIQVALPREVSEEDPLPAAAQGAQVVAAEGEEVMGEFQAPLAFRVTHRVPAVVAAATQGLAAYPATPSMETAPALVLCPIQVQ